MKEARSNSTSGPNQNIDESSPILKVEGLHKQFSSDVDVHMKQKLPQSGQKQGLQYYDRSRKPSFNKKVKNGYVHKCALEHDKKFQKKVDEGTRAMKKLFFVSFICFIFMGLEFAGGIISGSLAILTDAAHMFSDVMGFMISFFSIYISKNKSTFEYSMGYHRAEILGAFVSIFVIWGLLGWLNLEATRRLQNPGPEIDADIMLITACIGFACNVTNFCALNANCGAKADDEDDQEHQLYQSNVSARSYKSLSQNLMAVYQPSQAHKCLRNEQTLDSKDGDDIESCHGECEKDLVKMIQEHTPSSIPSNNTAGTGQMVTEFSPNSREKLIQQHKDKQEKRDDVGENMNVRAAVVHIMGDMVQSIGVIAAAIIIKFKPEWQIADPICTYVFSVLVLLTTVPIFLDCVKIVMEATPTDIDTVQMYNDILRLNTVEEIHDFHCWQLAGGKYILTCHVRSDFGDEAIRDVNKVCKGNQYGVFHTTVQVERGRCDAHVISCDHNA